MMLEIILLIIFITILIASFIVYKIYQKLNYYPSLLIKVNITKKNKMDNSDVLDYYIITYGIEKIFEHILKIDNWKQKVYDKYSSKEKKIYKFDKRCEKNEYKAFKFIAVRIQTRYKQKNYVKTPYKVQVISNEFYISDKEIKYRIDFLKENNFLITYNGYKSVDQRKVLTKELKETIKKRDNYTCQICGKYMPDEVGLHIDHIIPINKGGKSIPSNLQVLCSKCNGKKGAK